MTNSLPCCDECGAPAIVHISNTIQGERITIRLCTVCADRRSQAVAPTRRFLRPRLERTETGAIMLAIGLFVFTLSALADLFQFGSSEGFGWKQGTGLILAAVLTMMGSLFGVLVLVVIGVVVGLLTLLADFFSFGSNPGFGVQQKLGLFVGAIILLLGLRTMRRRGRTNSHQIANATADASGESERPRGSGSKDR